MFLNKKADLPLKPMGEIIIAALVFLSFYAAAVKLGSGELYKEINLGQSFAYATSAMLSFPENSIFSYTTDLKNYEISAKDNILTLKRIGLESIPVNRLYGGDSFQKIDISLKSPESFTLKKQGNQLKAYDKFSPPSNYLSCPDSAKPSKVLIIPSIKNGNEYEFTKQIHNLIIPSDSADSVTSQEDFIINIIDLKEEGNIIIYYAPDDASRRLACLIKNRFISASAGISIFIAPSQDFLLDKNKGIAIHINSKHQTYANAKLIAEAFGEY